MLITCTEEGVALLRGIANQINQGTENICSISGLLRTELESMVGIGPDSHMVQLLNCIYCIETEINKAASQAAIVSERVEEKADEYQEWMDSTAYFSGDGGSGTGTETGTPSGSTGSDSTSTTDSGPDNNYTDYKILSLKSSKFGEKYDEYSDLDAEDLVREECSVIENYTSENSKGSYKDINKSLYDPDFDPGSAEYGAKINHMVDVLTKCIDRKEMRQQAKLYRGINDASVIFGDDVNKLSPSQIIEKYTGKEYVNPAFTSTSASKEVAEGTFAQSGYGKDSGLITLRTPKGTKGICVGKVSAYKNSESEVILQRKTVYRIDKITYSRGRYDMIMTVIGNKIKKK